MSKGTKNRIYALDRGTFGGTKACHFLVDMLNEHGDARLSSSVVSSFSSYFSGLGEFLKLNSPHRDTVLKMWLGRAQEHAVAMWENHGIDPKQNPDGTKNLASLYDNVLHHRYRQTVDHGHLLEKFRERDLSHGEVLLALRNLAKYEKNRTEE